MKKNANQLLKFILLVLILTGFGFSDSISQEFKNGVLQGTIRIKIKPSIAEAVKITKSASTGIIKVCI